MDGSCKPFEERIFDVVSVSLSFECGCSFLSKMLDVLRNFRRCFSFISSTLGPLYPVRYFALNSSVERSLKWFEPKTCFPVNLHGPCFSFFSMVLSTYELRVSRLIAFFDNHSEEIDYSE